MGPSLRFLGSIFIFFPAFANVSGAQTVHLILAVDGQSELGEKNMNSDMRNMRQVFERNIPEDRLRVECLPINDLTAGKMVDAVEKLEAKHHDSIVFYYSGEGEYAEDRDESFFLLPRREPLSRKKIEELLRKKKVRLAVLLTDCCRSPIPIPVSPVEKDVKEVEPPDVFSPLFQTLFLESVGFVDLASCRPGERSYVDPSRRGRGSYFTRCLVELLENEAKKREFDWKNLAESLDRQVLRQVTEEVLKKYPSAREPQRIVLRSAPFHSRKAAGGVRFGAFVSEDGHSAGGLLVTYIFEESPAAQSGLRVGDRILAIDDTEVFTEKECLDLIKTAEKSITLRYFSSQKTQLMNSRINLAY